MHGYIGEFDEMSNWRLARSITCCGTPVALVRDTLGHSSVATTNGYLHARPNDSSARYLAV